MTKASQLMAEFEVTLKVRSDGRDPRVAGPEVRHTGFPISTNTRAEIDRAFAAVRQLFPQARNITIVTVGPAAVRQLFPQARNITIVTVGPAEESKQ